MQPTVLLVDDEPLVLQSLKRSLRKEKFRILCANSADEAMKLFEKEEIDLVVTDQDMPGTKGIDLLVYVKKYHPDVIRFMLTGKATLQVALDAINKGSITRFFTKPCNALELAIAIQQSIQQRDLLKKSKRLLRTARKQSYLLEQLEEYLPGITDVKRDEDGAILIEETMDTDIESFLNNLGGELVRFEEQVKSLSRRNFTERKK